MILILEIGLLHLSRRRLRCPGSAALGIAHAQDGLDAAFAVAAQGIDGRLIVDKEALHRMGAYLHDLLGAIGDPGIAAVDLHGQVRAISAAL